MHRRLIYVCIYIVIALSLCLISHLHAPHFPSLSLFLFETLCSSTALRYIKHFLSQVISTTSSLTPPNGCVWPQPDLLSGWLAAVNVGSWERAGRGRVVGRGVLEWGLQQHRRVREHVDAFYSRSRSQEICLPYHAAGKTFTIRLHYDAL